MLKHILSRRYSHQKETAVLESAFFKETGDVQEIPVMVVCDMLLQIGAIMTVYILKVRKKML